LDFQKDKKVANPKSKKVGNWNAIREDISQLPTTIQD